MAVEPALPAAADDGAVFRRCADGRGCEEASVKEFLAVQALMSELGGLKPADLEIDAFQRYLGWWEFIARARAFADAVRG
jgi:hypothetical protein